MLPENSPSKQIFNPGTNFHLGPNLDSELFIPAQLVEGTPIEVKNGWQKVEVTPKPGEKPLILYLATPEPKTSSPRSF